MRNRAISLRNSPASSLRVQQAIRPKDVAKAKKIQLPLAIYRNLAALFAALGDPTRAAIVHLLAHQELCTADLAFALGLKRPAASQHLRVLRQLRILRSRRESHLVLYSLDDTHVAELLSRSLEHVRETID